MQRHPSSVTVSAPLPSPAYADADDERGGCDASVPPYASFLPARVPTRCRHIWKASGAAACVRGDPTSLGICYRREGDVSC